MNIEDRRLLALGKEYNKLFIHALRELNHAFTELDDPLTEADRLQLQIRLGESIRKLEEFSPPEFFMRDKND